MNQTDLPTSLKVQLAASALAGQGTYGAITGLAQTFDVSRPTVYGAGQTAAEVLTQHFAACETGERSVVVDERQLERTIVGLRIVAPDSIRAIEGMLPIVYPGVQVSYGKIQRILSEAEQKTAEFNSHCDLSGIAAGALDEMFAQGNPVLAGVDLDSGYLFSLALRASRSGNRGQRIVVHMLEPDPPETRRESLYFTTGGGL